MLLEWSLTPTAGTHAHFLNDALLPPMLPTHLEDSDSWFAQHRHKRSVVFCPQQSGPFLCLCAQMQLKRTTGPLQSASRHLLNRGRGGSLPTGPIVFGSLVLSSCSLLVFCFCKVFEGLSAEFVLAGGKSVINRQRCSHGDQFVVILLVTLLLSVVFNNSTIYGQKYELE